ncbi:HAD family phosphatase [Amycolatopsis rhabdoformis]|uniref:HAD family phosphatase n=1 Tax=Amycolatopsis rhabdoformis TaxID=1448059 RepID=A0ABZ1IG68_9PSEU|nr:HAD family phosphatase [Amycolatopsis rhabdoformis]WSE32554.1 HAD family phosphatase [Amycolatopsis rhabdoformis]
MTIGAIAFDFGGVLTQPPARGFEEYARELGIPDPALAQYFLGGEMMARLEVGALSPRDFFRHVCVDAEEKYGQRIDIRRLAAAATAAETLDPAMIAFVRELSTHLPIALLTNNVASASWRATFPFDLFTTVVDSSEVGVRKPEPEIYQALIERLGLAPAEILFVDDLPANVTGATAVGIDAVLFTGLADLHQTLADRGLPHP